jgi:hypothetical protein
MHSVFTNWQKLEKVKETETSSIPSFKLTTFESQRTTSESLQFLVKFDMHSVDQIK